MGSASERSRLFNHAELVYAPGERDPVTRFFEALGCRVVDSGGPYLVVLLDPGGQSFYDNCLYVSEIVEDPKFSPRSRRSSSAYLRSSARRCSAA